MKKLTLALLSFFLVTTMGTTAFAAARPTDHGTYEIDGSLGFGTGPGDFDKGLGFNFGAGYILNNIDNLQARLDVGYFTFDRTFLGSTLDFTRVPVVISARYYFPISEPFRLFAQAGLETSFDSFDELTAFGFKQSKSEVNLGITPGGGAELFVNPNMSVFALGRIHIVSDHYVSMEFGAAYHF